jgi:alcohol dehydrogenase class IV
LSRFEFATATRIVFGRGAIEDAGVLARDLGRQALVVTGANADRADPIVERLRRHDVFVTTIAAAHEPDVELVERGVWLARESECDLVVGVGGGSAIDTGKAIAVLATNPGEVFDYLEVVGRSQPLTEVALPFVAIPTTAGTGSEATRNAVLSSPSHRVKASLRSPLMFPSVALVDPDLTAGCPPALTASTGLDALTQLVEAYLSPRANPMTDAVCVDGIGRAAGALRRAFENGADLAAREDMALASLLSGIALTNAGLGAVHGFAGPIGGMFDAPHGAICATLLPHVMAANLCALQSRAPDHPALRRLEHVARLLTRDQQATAEDGVRWLERLVRELAIPSLPRYGLTSEDIPAVVEHAQRASSMKSNPVKLTGEELTDILSAAIRDPA